ncbi:hypothetical protein ACGF5M_03415 [Gemmatimonadota bacterium]
MGILSKIRSRSLDPLEERAEKLVPAVEALGEDLMTPLLDEYPRLSMAITEHGLKEWHLLFTVGAVFFALRSLARKVGTRRHHHLAKIPFDPHRGARDVGVLSGDDAEDSPLSRFRARRREVWYREGKLAMDDCAGSVKRATIGVVSPEVREEIVHVTVGTWILRNLYGKPLGPEDAELAGKIGLTLKSLFADWWG